MLWALTGAQWLTISWTVGILVVMEGLLSADNALVLAMMVRHLPRDQQKRALRYGIWGAFVFRLIAVAFASILLDFWPVEVLGGLYLGWLALRHFLQSDHHDAGGAIKSGRSFWHTVFAVELADIAFSADSILAAVGVADGMPQAIKVQYFLFAPLKLWVVYVGGVLGILTMRYVAGMFLRLLERYPGLADGAYLLVGWIGLKLVGMGLHHAFHPHDPPADGSWLSYVPEWVINLPLEMPGFVFWGGMMLILVLSLFLKPRSRGGLPADQEDHAMAVADAARDDG